MDWWLAGKQDATGLFNRYNIYLETGPQWHSTGFCTGPATVSDLHKWPGFELNEYYTETCRWLKFSAKPLPLRTDSSFNWTLMHYANGQKTGRWNLMSPNAKSCTPDPETLTVHYFMNGQLLNSVTEHKDLGVIISSNLKVADHCHYASNKANKILGLIKRTIKHRNITVMVHLYKSG